MDLDAFAALLSPAGQRLLASLPAYDDAAALGVGERLRREHPPALVAAALTQSRLRGRARGKFGDAAAGLYFTPDGLEQATRPVVAASHADRYARAGIAAVADLCCGIGTDSMALRSAGRRVVAVERDPLTAAVAAANLGHRDAEVRCEDVTATDLSAVRGAFVDPARRTPRGRTGALSAYSPPFSFVLDLAARLPGTGAKVAPGIPHAALPAGAEAQWVSVDGDVVEAGLWFGPLATPGVRRSALLLGRGTSPVLVPSNGVEEPPPAGAPGRVLYEPDGAVIRAGLVGRVTAAVGGRLLDPTIAYVTADALVATPLATPYRVLDVLPFQLKRLRSTLRARGVGHVVVKKRGSAIAPEELRRQLRLTGDATLTVVLTRVAGAPWALLVEPVAPDPAPR